MQARAWTLFLAMITGTTSGCIGATGDEALMEEEAAGVQCPGRKAIYRYTYSHGGSQYRFDVTYEIDAGRTWLDQKKIGGPRLPQHRVRDEWLYCLFEEDYPVTFTAGGHTHRCTHSCGLFGSRDELHCDSWDVGGGGPVQLTLAPEDPLIVFECPQ